MIYKNMKVFDCTDMPQDVRDKFYNYHDKGNDTYVKVYVGDDYGEEDANAISNWLITNGAIDGEQVLVKYWW